MTHTRIAHIKAGGLAVGGVLVGMLVLMWPVPGPLGAGQAATMQTNYCVDCHQRAETQRAFPVWARDQITHWYGAVHGEAGVTCEQCHGGNPRAVFKEEAHEGVVSPRKPESPLSYKNVAASCGTCHSEVYQQFKQSNHYEVLMSDHLAPSCTTCHGFEMDMDAVTPIQMLKRCALCHNERRGLSPEFPEIARAALEGSAQLSKDIDRTRIVVELAREQGADAMVSSMLLDNARTRLRETGDLWHRFKLDVFQKELDEIEHMVDHAYSTATAAIREQGEKTKAPESGGE